MARYVKDFDSMCERLLELAHQLGKEPILMKNREGVAKSYRIVKAPDQCTDYYGGLENLEAFRLIERTYRLEPGKF